MRRSVDDQQIELLHAVRPGDIAPRDAQDLFIRTNQGGAIDFRIDNPCRGARTRHGDDLGRRRLDLGRIADR